MEQNKQTVRDLLNGIGRSETDVVDGLLAPEATWEITNEATEGTPFGGIQDKAAFLKNVAGFRELFAEGIRYEILSMTAEDDRVAVEAIGHGVAHGLTLRNRYLFLFQLRNGKVVTAREYMDFGHALTFHAQLTRILASGGDRS